MIASARIAAFNALCRIILASVHSDDALNSEDISELDARDRNLATEITYGTLRWQSWLDYVLTGAVSRPRRAVEQPIVILLRMSLYQMSLMGRVPAHAVINDAVELARRAQMERASGFVNGVLRTLDRKRPWLLPDFHRDCPIWVRASLPRWLWQRWESRFGTDRAFEYAASLNRPPRPAIRLVNGESSAIESIIGAGWTRSEIMPGTYLAANEERAIPGGDWYSMDEASQLVPCLFGSVDGGRIWDACAAPGGKSAVLCERCGPRGVVVSSDSDPERARRMRDRLKSYNPDRSCVLIMDAQTPPGFGPSFDAVLADVPCSGLGTLRRNPEIKWRLKPEQFGRLSARQNSILGQVASAVRRRPVALFDLFYGT